MLGTPSYESFAAIDAAAQFLLDTGMDVIQAHERELFARLLDGLLADERVTVYGPHDLADRAPTLAFNVAGLTAEIVAERSPPNGSRSGTATTTPSRRWRRSASTVRFEPGSPCT